MTHEDITPRQRIKEARDAAFNLADCLADFNDESAVPNKEIRQVAARLSEVLNEFILTTLGRS